MSLIRWKSVNDLDQFLDEPFAMPFSRVSLDLAADIYEEDDQVVAKLSLPDVDPDEVDVTIDDDLLTISGERQEEAEIDTKEYYAKEIRRGAFSRAFRLPRSVDATKATAQFERGILTIIAPAVPDTKRNAVQVPINGI